MKITEDELMELALEAGADDIKHEGNIFEILTDPVNFEIVREAIISRGIEPLHAEISRIPSSSIPVDENKGRKVITLLNNLEDHDDVVNVYANYDLSDEIMKKILAET
jgi:transcriptional/translational regulatory protein YebC/TACO1